MWGKYHELRSELGLTRARLAQCESCAGHAYDHSRALHDRLHLLEKDFQLLLDFLDAEIRDETRRRRVVPRGQED